MGAKVLIGGIELVNVGRGPSTKVHAQIIGGHRDYNQKFYTLYDTLFLNAGSASHLGLGQVVPLYRSIILRKEKPNRCKTVFGGGS